MECKSGVKNAGFNHPHLVGGQNGPLIWQAQGLTWSTLWCRHPKGKHLVEITTIDGSGNIVFLRETIKP